MAINNRDEFEDFFDKFNISYGRIGTGLTLGNIIFVFGADGRYLGYGRNFSTYDEKPGSCGGKDD